MFQTTIWLLALSALVASFKINIDDCKYEAFDFTPLSNPNQDYVIQTKSYTYYVNFCIPVVDKNCGTDAEACQYWSPYAYASLGTASSRTFSKDSDNRVVAHFSQGSAGRQFDITFECSNEAGIGSPEFVSEGPELNYHFIWKTEVVCGDNCMGADCDSCLNNGSCSWCLDTNTCMSNTTSAGTCKNYVGHHKYCPAACNTYRSCRKCVDAEHSECNWCLDDRKCISQSTPCSDRVSNKDYCDLKDSFVIV